MPFVHNSVNMRKLGTHMYSVNVPFIQHIFSHIRVEQSRQLIVQVLMKLETINRKYM